MSRAQTAQTGAIWSILRRVLHWIRPYWGFLLLSLLLAAASVGTQLLVPILTGNAIDAMLGAGRVDFAALAKVLGAIALSAGVTALAQWGMNECNNRMAFCVSRDLRNAAIRKIQVLPLRYLDGHPTGDLVSRVIADVDAFSDGLLMGFTQLFTSLWMYLFSVGGDHSIYLGTVFGFFGLFWILVGFFFLKGGDKKVMAHFFLCGLILVIGFTVRAFQDGLIWPLGIDLVVIDVLLATLIPAWYTGKPALTKLAGVCNIAIGIISAFLLFPALFA